MEPLTPEIAAELLVWFLIAMTAAIATTAVFGWLLFRAGRLRHPGPLIVSVSMLTAIALVGGIIADNTEVLTLAATGLGALAGSLAAVYNHGDDDPEPPNGSPNDAQE